MDVMSWRLATPRCGAHIAAGPGGTPRQCSADVTHTGLILQSRPVEAWQAWACTAHAGELRAPRQLLDRDRALLADWRDREARALAGKGWDSPKPLAVGAAAHELLRRAEAVAG